MELVGAVLAGGRSSRLGTDKAFVALDGEPLVVRCARALIDAGATEVVVIGGDRSRARIHGLRVIDDRYPGEGPVGGVLTALDARPDASMTMILPCDLAQPSAEAIRATVEALSRRPGAACCVPDDGERPQWLHSCWRRNTARDPLSAAFDAGARSFRAATVALEVLTVEIASQALADIDTPEDLAQASYRAGGGRGTSVDGGATVE